MKVLIFGPSGSGKTYIAHALQQSGINAYDADEIKGLSAWYNNQGKRVSDPLTVAEALNNHYAFLWNRRFLKEFLIRFVDVYLFGGSGNLFDVIDLFDNVFFLQVSSQVQKERLMSSLRKTPQMDFDENGLVIWGNWFEQEARKRNIPFINASLTPTEIFSIINKQ
jgi:dephospho-CoA kinase